jgi:hypothetical protein
MKLEITQKTNKPFIGSEGDPIDYFWYVGLREEDNVSIRFGSTDGSMEIGQKVDLILEKTEKLTVNKKTGKRKIEFAYRQFISK